jgi:glycosyltransferase involved in cell wall biosynthesis
MSPYKPASERRLKVAMCTYGDPGNVSHSSGTMYYLMKSLQALGGANYGSLPLPRAKRYSYEKAVWLARNLARMGLSRGYFLSEASLQSWLPILQAADYDVLFCNFQLLPMEAFERIHRRGAKVGFYIDHPLAELLLEKRWTSMHSRYVDDILGREREGYRLADFVMTFSRGSAQILIDKYGVAERKITVVHPGPNIEENLVPDVEELEKHISEFGVTVGFIGMDYERKGLPQIVGAIDRLRSEGLNVRLKVIGPSPSEYRHRPFIELTGRIDKAKNAELFCKHVLECDIGVLASTSEAFGISVVEFLRFGKPVFAAPTLGLREICDGKAAVSLDAANMELSITRALREIIVDRGRLQEMRRHALAGAVEWSWSAAARQIDRVVREVAGRQSQL